MLSQATICMLALDDKKWLNERAFILNSSYTSENKESSEVRLQFHWGHFQTSVGAVK